MKKTLIAFLIASLLFVFCPISYAENTLPMRGPICPFSATILHHKCVVGGITRPNGSSWKRAVTVTVSNLEKPSGTDLRITLVDNNGNKIGDFQDWSTKGEKTLLLDKNKVDESTICLELRNTERIGNIVTNSMSAEPVSLPFTP